MGVEYYLVKPDKQEIFELGRHIEPFEGIRAYPAKPAYAEYDYFKEFFLDLVESNGSLIGDSYTFEEVQNFAYEIWEWIEGEKVYITSDCSKDESWTTYNVTGSIYDYCEKHPSLESVMLEVLSKIGCDRIRKDNGDTDITQTIGNYYGIV